MSYPNDLRMVIDAGARAGLARRAWRAGPGPFNVTYDATKQVDLTANWAEATATNGTVTPNSSTQDLFGIKTVKIVTGTDAGALLCRYTVPAPPYTWDPATLPVLEIWFHVDNAALLAPASGVGFVFRKNGATGAYISSACKYLQGFQGVRTGWNCVRWTNVNGVAGGAHDAHGPLATDPDIGGGFAWGDESATGFSLLDVVVTPLGATPVTVHVAMIRQTSKAPGYVVFSFDDGYDEQAHAAHILAGHGYRGNLFVPTDLIGGVGKLTFPQLQDLAAQGHVICNHGASHDGTLYTNGVSVADSQADIQAGINALLANGLTEGAYFLASPFGGQCPNSITAARNAACKCYRISTSTTQRLWLGSGGDPYINMGTISLDSQAGEVALVKDRLDHVQAYGGVAILNNHYLAMTGGENIVTPTDLEDICDYVAAQSNITVMTLPELWAAAFEALPAPNPTLAATFDLT